MMRGLDFRPDVQHIAVRGASEGEARAAARPDTLCLWDLRCYRIKTVLFGHPHVERELKPRRYLGVFIEK